MHRFPQIAAFLTKVARDWFHSCDELHGMLREMASKQEMADVYKTLCVEET